MPLKSLGDGAVRLLSIALGLANSAGALLVMDEADLGIHHAAHRGFSSMILETVTPNNVQVLATTHSWDCVRGFAQAANDLDDIEGAVVRIEKMNHEIVGGRVFGSPAESRGRTRHRGQIAAMVVHGSGEVGRDTACCCSGVLAIRESAVHVRIGVESLPEIHVDDRGSVEQVLDAIQPEVLVSAAGRWES